jgi:DNA-binding transcriptional ArsR family regulator
MKQLDHPDVNGIRLEAVLAALADPVRLSIVAALSDQSEHSASAFDCDIASSTLSHHLKVLREAGVISHRKEGTRCFVSLRPELNQVFPGLLNLVLEFAPKDRD